jgi:3'-phosphoadenosine 5'-phosphosulfate sulfotransferase (PAPS reductase)/FAD synthetase
MTTAVKRPRLSISFSGGRSSAVMLHLTYAKEIERRPVVVTFANTGAEHPATLDFVRDVETHWNIPIAWIEAEINPVRGEGTRAHVVRYENASRAGEPFEAAVAKHGVFNRMSPACTRELKTRPILSYLRDVIGWKSRSYSQALGIRADEIDRVNIDKLDSGEIVYPLVEAGFTKEMVGAYMKRQPFDLGIPGDHYGNCVTCWKKSERKLFTIAQNDPSHFDLFARLERQYGHIRHDNHNASDSDSIKFFRGNRSAADIVREAHTLKFEPYSDTRQLSMWDLMLDIGGGCGDSCEIDTDEQ